MKTLSERPFDHRFELTTGKVFVANRFIIGLSTNLQVFEGYDGTLFEQDFTIAERMEIAKYMKTLWESYIGKIQEELANVR